MGEKIKICLQLHDNQSILKNTSRLILQPDKQAFKHILNHYEKINKSGQQRLLKINNNFHTLLFTLVTMGDQLKIFFAASFASMRSTQLYQNIPHLPKHSVLERLKTRKRAHFRVLHPCTPNSTLFRWESTPFSNPISVNFEMLYRFKQ